MAKPEIDPHGSAESIITALGKMSSGEAMKWVETNEKELDDQTLVDVIKTVPNLKATFQGDSEISTGTPLKAWDRFVKGDQDSSADKKAALDKRVAEHDSRITAAATQIQAQNPQLTADEAKNEANKQLGADPTLTGIPPVNKTPDIVYKYTGGQDPTDRQKNELIKTWNEFNPDNPVTNWDQMSPILWDTQTNPMTTQIIDSAFNGTDPVTRYEFKFGAQHNLGPNDPEARTKSTTIGVDASQFDAFSKLFGKDFTRKDLGQFAYIANESNLRDPVTGQVAWQIVATLAKASGALHPDSQASAADVPDRPGHRGQTQESIDTAKKTRSKAIRGANDLAQDRKLVYSYKEGLSRYGGNESLAYLHALNPSLAAQISTTAPTLADGSPNPRIVQLNSQANKYLLMGGFNTQDLQSLGYYARDLTEFSDANGGGPTTKAARTLPDPEAVRQTARDMYRSLFKADPSEEELTSLVGAVNSAITGAADNQNIDPTAQIKKKLEGSSQYADLYHNRPSGVDEAAYGAQFESAQQSILGNQSSNTNAVRSGMRQGLYQTTVGAATLDPQAGQNSAYQGRLAEAARIASEMT